MPPKFNVGVVGAGMWGKTHIAMFQAESRASVRWVCDPDGAALEAARKQYGIEHVSQHPSEMLGDPEVHAVIVASPPFSHVSIGLEVLRAGKHLLIEKPMAIDPAGASQLVAEARRHPGLIVLEGSCRHARLNPKFDFIKSMIERGQLGRVYHIHHVHLSQGTFVEYNPNGRWAMDRRWSGGGPVMDWGEYDLSFHLGILDDRPVLQSVKSFARGDLRNLGPLAPVVNVEMHGAAYMEFDTGLTYYYERGAGVHGETRCETRVQGTKGGLHFFYPSWESPTIEYFFAEAQPQKQDLRVDMSQHPAHDNLLVVSHFLDCLEGKSQPQMTAELAAKHLDILFQILGAQSPPLSAN